MANTQTDIISLAAFLSLISDTYTLGAILNDVDY